LLGRSIGSGPVTHLGRVRMPGALILVSPFTSIRDVVKNMVGDFISNVIIFLLLSSLNSYYIIINNYH
jgi:hypothetical protein